MICVRNGLLLSNKKEWTLGTWLKREEMRIIIPSEKIQTRKRACVYIIVYIKISKL